MVEERHAGLVPQTVAHQHGRVDRRREDRRGRYLRDVVEVGELGGADLEVNLEARVAGLEHHAVMARLQLVEPGDLQLELAARGGDVAAGPALFENLVAALTTACARLEGYLAT